MFRKLTEQLSSGWGNSDAAKVRQLMALGFGETSARQALASTNGNVEQAAELLLLSQTPDTANTVSNNPARTATAMTEEEQVRRAVEASLQVVPPPTRPGPSSTTTTTRRNGPTRSAATHKARQAALQRSNTKSPPSSGNSSLSDHHPTVKVIPKLSEKPTEEQILRTADRLKSSYAAVDTLLKAITAVQQHPSNPKFRTIDTTTPGYQRSIAPAPGAADFLYAMNYRRVGSNKLVLDLPLLDPALLYLGISALEQTKLTTEYRLGKAQAVFTKELVHLRADSSDPQALARATHLSQCPTEPPVGRATNLQVSLGEDIVRRRFESDDTLMDVMHWLGAHGSQIFDKLQDGSWVLVDVHRNVVLNVQRRANDTLQYLECWPSGRLQLTTQALVELQGIGVAE